MSSQTTFYLAGYLGVPNNYAQLRFILLRQRSFCVVEGRAMLAFAEASFRFRAGRRYKSSHYPQDQRCCGLFTAILTHLEFNQIRAKIFQFYPMVCVFTDHFFLRECLCNYASLECMLLMQRSFCVRSGSGYSLQAPMSHMPGQCHRMLFTAIPHAFRVQSNS